MSLIAAGLPIVQQNDHATGPDNEDCGKGAVQPHFAISIGQVFDKVT